MRLAAPLLVVLLAACGGVESNNDPDPSCTPACDDRSCGDDGCEGSCGTCDDGFACSAAFACEATSCVPDCDGRACGDDGCGGSCGSCDAGQRCDDGAGVCSTSAPTLSGDVQAIFSLRCTGSCHAGRAPSEGLDLSSATRTWEGLVDQPSACAGHTLVVPGNADESYLIAKLMGVAICGNRMPQGSAALGSAQIELIRAWIDAGAAND